MAGRRRRQRSKNKHKTAARSDIPSGPTTVHQVPDHLLELVLLRVGSSVALVRVAFTCKRWRRLVADTAFLARFRSLHAAHVAGRTRWSLYWTMERDGAVLSLDESTLEFSLAMFPDAVVGWRDELSTFWVIGGEDGAVRVVRMINRGLTVFAQLQGGGEWVTEKVVRLRPADIVAANERYVLLTPRGQTCLFSVELDTLQAESTHERNRCAGAAYPGRRERGHAKCKPDNSLAKPCIGNFIITVTMPSC
ncbi:hypothetical protein TRIUR3_33461 [Triticum urartu]|uniref:Uncharacterized protein n=1 Tax=Triticum urartu TaxID=4572 RepID=M7YL95_TRIUA|nr:hypothetical protein TRIUR3_33461 [Triticum urartu]